jgi:hypothetical protein
MNNKRKMKKKKFYRDFGCWFWKLRVSLKQQERLLETLVVTSL